MSKLHRFAAQNRENLLKYFKPNSSTSALILLKAETHHNRKWTDAEMPWRQESNFWWATGCDEPDYILTLDPNTKRACMFIPNYDADHALWSGSPLTCSEVKTKFGVSDCLTMDSLPDLLVNFQEIHVIERGELSSSFQSSESTFKIVDSVLKFAIQEARVFKSEIELEMMRKACEISSHAHIAVMKSAKSFQGKSEHYFSSVFNFECSKLGGYIQAYNSIVGAGKRAAVLHSSPTPSLIACTPQEFVLVDAGCEFQYYASDITRTFPFSGEFVAEWKEIYEIVLQANKSVIETMKAGTNWEDMHRLAENVILDGLIRLGIVTGPRQELVNNHIAALFFPHGLGHLLGLDVHDTSLVAYPKGVDRIPEPGIKYLRMRRKLEVGMVVTVEPGIYFVDPILRKALANEKLNQYINIHILEKYTKVGGVRIEDDCAVHADRIEVLSHLVPKEISDIESIMAMA